MLAKASAPLGNCPAGSSQPRFRNVGKGLHFEQLVSSAAVGRITAIENSIDLATSLSGMSNPTGIEISSDLDGGYGEVLFNRNLIRKADPAAVPAIRGIVVARPDSDPEEIVQNLLAEHNIIEHTAAEDALRYSHCTSAKFFNNQNGDGDLLRAYKTGSARYNQELEDHVEDVLLAR